MENKFTDAQQMHQEYPESFQVIHINDLRTSVEPLDFVKVCHSGERFWVHLNHRDGDQLRGRVANQIAYAPFEYGQQISFEMRHVMDHLPHDYDIEFAHDDEDNIDGDNVVDQRQNCNWLLREYIDSLRH